MAGLLDLHPIEGTGLINAPRRRIGGLMAPAAYTTADLNAMVEAERKKRLPVRSSFFGGIVPQVSAQDAAVNRPILDESQRGQPGVISKLLIGGAANAAETFGLPGVFDPSGDIRNQSWGNALKASAWIPQDSVEGIAQAITAPARAVRGEIPDEDMISEGLNFAGNMAMTGSIAPKPTNAAGMFGGRLAKTADHAALARAEEMAAKGVPREDIWSQTGWFKGVDGKWRFEIDDSGATYNGAAPGQLKNLFDHNNLYAAYPQMKTWGVTPIDDVNVGAYYNSAQGAKRPIWAQLIDRVIGYNPHTIVAGPRNADKTTLLHELTHGVQDIEGVSMPSGSAYYSGDLKSYNNMANEVEARSVQKRMDLTPEQRSSRPPWLDYDVPESQQIVRFNANSSEAAAPGVVVSEAARQPLEVPFYRGSAHGQTSVDYSQPYWGVSHGIPDVAQKLASHYAKSRSGMYFNADTTPNVTPAVARFRNPLEVDAQNAGWSQIPFEGGTISTDKLADLAKERGHDGLVVNRLYDEGRVDEALGLPSTVAALRPGTVSSAFDPNNILYSNGAKSAAPGVVLSEASKRVENQIRAYHGSPHDFDRFDMSKIGSGEGAQAYGHGLYFAEREGVARSYRDALGGQKLSDGSKFDDANPAHKAAAYIAGTSSKDEAIKALVDDIAMSRRQYDEAHAQRLMRAKGMLERGEPIPTIGNGKMYEVALHASPDDFLDWDKPLSQQSEKVRKVLEQSVPSQGLGHARTGNAEPFGGSGKGQPTSNKSDGFISRPLGGVMPNRVLPMVDDSKVFNPVVGLDAVDVVNVLGGKKVTPDVVGHNSSMLFDELPVEGRNAVAFGVGGPNSSMQGVASAAAKGLGGNTDVVPMPLELSRALRANEIDQSSPLGNWLPKDNSTTEWLKSKGVAGTKYLDQGSRDKAFRVDLETSRGPYNADAPVTFSTHQQAQQYADRKAAEGFKTKIVDQGSRNYVAFDADLIEILRKYMNPQTAIAPGALMVEGAKDRRQ